MDEAQKMEALKKAYAEIILNTAKEAAARVTVSERKAIRFQHDLRSTNDEALRMLLRLKQMMDTKTTEAEVKSLGHQRRVEELDAQLNEAEEVIVDLRAELRKARDRLKEVKNSHMQHSNRHLENEPVPVPYRGNAPHEKKLEMTEPSRSASQSDTCCNPAKESGISAPHSDNLFVNDPNLASLIIGSKEPDLYRNGCTHRIRAIERNSLGEKIIPPENLRDQVIRKKDDLTVGGDDQHFGKCHLSSIEAENTDTKNLDASEVLSIDRIATINQTVEVRRCPRSSVRYAKSGPNLSRFRRCQSTKPTTKHEKVDLEDNSSEQEERLMENNEVGACSLRRSLRKRKSRCWDDISSLFKKRAALSCRKKYSDIGKEKSGQRKIKSKYVAGMKQVMVPSSAYRNSIEHTKAGALSEIRHNYAVEDAELLDVPIVVKDEVTAAKALTFSSCNLIIESDRALKTDSMLSASPGGAAASESDRNKLLLHTFSRKCKRALLTKSDDSPSVGKSSITSRMGEKPTISHPSNGSENMVEVACQLISLSGKHEW